MVGSPKKGTKTFLSLNPAVSEVPSRRCCCLWRTNPWCDTPSCGVTVLQSVIYVPLISSGFSSKRSKISPIFWLKKYLRWLTLSTNKKAHYKAPRGVQASQAKSLCCNQGNIFSFRNGRTCVVVIAIIVIPEGTREQKVEKNIIS